MKNDALIVQIQSAIASLYLDAELLGPTAAAPITPLGELVRHQNVTCTELTKLSIKTAMTFLLKRGALAEAFEDSTLDALAGFLYANSNFGSIFVEKDDLLTRRRFSVAHELGHFLLHFQPLLAESAEGQETFIEAFEAFPRTDPEVEPDELPTGHLNLLGVRDDTPIDYFRLEQEANQFAVELLMTSHVVSELAEHYAAHFRGEDLVWRLASETLVSRAAMRWRLKDLGLFAPVDTPLN